MSLLIAFVPGTRLRREADRVSDLPIVGNGPPGTFFAAGTPGQPRTPTSPARIQISLPTDQIVSAQDAENDDEHDGGVRVEFGGMRFLRVDRDALVFQRVRDLHPEAQLSPARSHVMTLETWMVASVRQDGVEVWPVGTGPSAVGP